MSCVHSDSDGGEDELKLKVLRMQVKAGVDALKRGEFEQRENSACKLPRGLSIVVTFVCSKLRGIGRLGGRHILTLTPGATQLKIQPLDASAKGGSARALRDPRAARGGSWGRKVQSFFWLGFGGLQVWPRPARDALTEDCLPAMLRLNQDAYPCRHSTRLLRGCCAARIGRHGGGLPRPRFQTRP